MKNIQLTSWGEQKQAIKQVNSELFNVVEELDLGDDLPLYKVKYPYGAKIIESGTFQVMNDKDEMVPIDHDSIPRKASEDLNFAKVIPMGLLLKGVMELYIQGENQTYPLFLFKPGKMCATTGIFSKDLSNRRNNFWQATAGVKTTFITSKLTNNALIRNLSCQHKYEFTVPKSYNDQWQLFTEISKAVESNWELEMIFFPKAWFKNLDQLRWKGFKLFVLEYGWEVMNSWRLAHWNDYEFSMAASRCHKRSYHTFTYRLAKHLIAISKGYWLGLSITNSDEYLPRSDLLDLIADATNQRNVEPVFVVPDYIYDQSNRTLLYSLAYNTCEESTEKKSTSSRKTNEILDVSLLIQAIGEVVASNPNLFIDTGFLSSLSDTTFECYHNHTQQSPKLKNSIKLIEELKINGSPKSPFFNGIIKIKRKNP